MVARSRFRRHALESPRWRRAPCMGEMAGSTPAKGSSCGSPYGTHRTATRWSPRAPSNRLGDREPQDLVGEVSAAAREHATLVGRVRVPSPTLVGCRPGRAFLVRHLTTCSGACGERIRLMTGGPGSISGSRTRGPIAQWIRAPVYEAGSGAGSSPAGATDELNGPRAPMVIVVQWKHRSGIEKRRPRAAPSVTAMDVTVHASLLPHDGQEASLAFYRDRPEEE